MSKNLENAILPSGEDKKISLTGKIFLGALAVSLIAQPIKGFLNKYMIPEKYNANPIVRTLNKTLDYLAAPWGLFCCSSGDETTPRVAEVVIPDDDDSQGNYNDDNDDSVYNDDNDDNDDNDTTGDDDSGGEYNIVEVNDPDPPELCPNEMGCDCLDYQFALEDSRIKEHSVPMDYQEMLDLRDAILLGEIPTLTDATSQELTNRVLDDLRIRPFILGDGGNIETFKKEYLKVISMGKEIFNVGTSSEFTKEKLALCDLFGCRRLLFLYKNDGSKHPTIINIPGHSITPQEYLDEINGQEYPKNDFNLLIHGWKNMCGGLETDVSRGYIEHSLNILGVQVYELARDVVLLDWMSEKENSPVKKNEIVFVAHSGGVVPLTALSRLTNYVPSFKGYLTDYWSNFLDQNLHDFAPLIWDTRELLNNNYNNGDIFWLRKPYGFVPPQEVFDFARSVLGK